MHEMNHFRKMNQEFQTESYSIFQRNKRILKSENPEGLSSNPDDVQLEDILNIRYQKSFRNCETVHANLSTSPK